MVEHDWLIVGAGFAGSVLAERIANVRNERVLLVDRRDHIGGNAYDCLSEEGLLYHLYGPHIFHTNSQAIVDYLSGFTGWRPYEHRVLASVDGQLVPIPINRTTINRLYGLNLDEVGVEAFLAEKAEPIADIRTSEDVVVTRVGRELYEKFFRGYTRKQWGLDPSELDSSVTARVPTRTNDDDRYFTDSFQAMPANGYTSLFRRMLANPLITLELETDGLPLRSSARRTIFTGRIDEYYDFRLGVLPYRSLNFLHKPLAMKQFQPVATINFPQDKDYTRITEVKHITGQRHPSTMLTFEYPTSEGDPYYPVPHPASAALYKRYEQLALREPDTWFVGRLATYRYYNMDQVVGQALATFRRIEERIPRKAQDQPVGPKAAVRGRAA